MTDRRSSPILAAFAALLMLTGCGYTSMQDSSDPTPTGNMGLVIVGFGYLGEGTGLLRIGCPVRSISIPGQLAPLNIEFLRMDEAGRTSMLDRYFATRGTCKKLDPDNIEGYNFLHLPAGRYVVSGLVNAYTFRAMSLPGAPVIEVAAGESVYIGDVWLNGTVSFGSIDRHARLAVRDSEDGARAALAARGGDPARLASRIMALPPPRPVVLDDPAN
ncbi:MAG: hypothetical protein NBV67_14990 [Tagaea sp.]|nr:hypothetical protein [Tagaea sp.]